MITDDGKHYWFIDIMPAILLGEHSHIAGEWFTYDDYVEEWHRWTGGRFTFGLSRSQFGRELANFCYHRRSAHWLRVRRGPRYREYQIVPIFWEE